MRGKSNLKNKIKEELNKFDISYSDVKITDKTITIIMEDPDCNLFDIKQSVDNATACYNIKDNLKILVDL